MKSANLMQYFRHSFRLLQRSPVFSAVVVLMLALGIGANTAVFSVVDGVLLRKLPYRDPDRLVMIWEKNPALGAQIGERIPANYTNFAEWQRQSSAFEGIAGMEDANLNRTGEEQPERVTGARISANFFQVLGVTHIHRRDVRLRATKHSSSDSERCILGSPFRRKPQGHRPEHYAQ